MPAPTGGDGLGRAIEEFLLPSVGLLVLVVFVREYVGPVTAGLLYLLVTGVVLLGIYVAAEHWNIPYTGVFVAAGLVFIWLAPGVVSELIHPVVGFLATLLGVVFLIGMVLLFLEKAGLVDL